MPKNRQYHTAQKPGRTRRIAAITLATTGLLGLGAAAASAHITVSPDSTPANSYSVLTFSVPHGCDASPTTKVTFNLPKELADATPTVNPNWTVEKITEKLDQPMKLENGSTVTERTGQIVYTAKTPLDPHERDTLALQVKMPDDAGKTLTFPVLQTCQTGSTDWSQTLAPGAPKDSVAHPAPAVKLTTPAQQTSSAEPVAASSTSDAGTAVPAWIGFGAGIIGLVLGGIALIRTRRAEPARAEGSTANSVAANLGSQQKD